MNLRSRNKVKPDFSMSSLTDIIFLLLIFFMLTSTLVSPNVLKLLLPQSSSQALAKQTISVSITEDIEYYVNKEKIALGNLMPELKKRVSQEEDPTIVLNVAKSVATEHLVEVLDIGKQLKVKMVLATSPKK